MRKANGPRDDEQGLALVSVLWVVLLLSIVAASMVMGTRANGASTSSAYARARAEAAAEAGVARALLALLASQSSNRGKPDDPSIAFSFAEADVTVTIADETGKVDVNIANDQLLRSLFKSTGLSEDAADGLFDKVADWRDEGDLHRLAGADVEDYREKGYPYGPRKAAFDTVDELKEVMDLTPDIFAKLRPALTVYSLRDSLDPTVASAAALGGLSQMIGGQADAATVPPPKADLSNGTAGGTNAVDDSALTGRAFTIRVIVRFNERAALNTETVVRLTGNSRQPFWILRSSGTSS